MIISRSIPFYGAFWGWDWCDALRTKTLMKLKDPPFVAFSRGRIKGISPLVLEGERFSS